MRSDQRSAVGDIPDGPARPVLPHVLPTGYDPCRVVRAADHTYLSTPGAGNMAGHVVVDNVQAGQGGKLVDGIWFNHVDMLPERVTLAYRLSLDEWQGQQRVQYMIEAMQA